VFLQIQQQKTLNLAIVFKANINETMTMTMKTVYFVQHGIALSKNIDAQRRAQIKRAERIAMTIWCRWQVTPATWKIKHLR